MRILFFLFVLLPLLELYVLIEVGSGIGGLATIALCLLTAATGGLIIRWQGLQTLLQAKQSIATLQQHQLGAWYARIDVGDCWSIVIHTRVYY